MQRKRPRGGTALYLGPGQIKRLKTKYARRQRARAQQAPWLAGRDRVGGYYGRYAGDKAEHKFHDLDIDDSTIAAGATVAQASCNLIAQGVTESTRVGRKCTVRAIGWRFFLTLKTTAVAADTSDTVRILLYMDKQCNGATIATTDLLESADIQSFNNLANKGRFRVLMDRTYAISSQAGSGRGTTDTLSYGEVMIQDTFFKKCNIPIEFDSTTGAITEIRSNNIGVLTLAASGNVAFNSKMRLRYSDK